MGKNLGRLHLCVYQSLMESSAGLKSADHVYVRGQIALYILTCYIKL